MNRLIILTSFVLLAACGTFEASLEPVPAGGTIQPAITSAGPTSFEAQVVATATGLVSPTVEPVVTLPLATPAPTLPRSTAVEAYAAPAPTRVLEPHIPAVKHLFQVSPFQNLKPGDTVTVVWEAEGNNATLCLMLLDGSPPRDCMDLPMQGERRLTVPNTDRPYRLGLYLNMASQDFTHAEAIASANLFVGCPYEWFFDQPEVPTCPISAPQTGRFAAQRFERGWLLWARPPGRYIALVNESFGGSYEKKLLTTYDPLNVLRDTSADTVAPQGVFAPTSGFGIVWRGDAEYTEGYAQALGWGLGLEFGYDGLYQCDASMSRWQFCYVRHPEGAVVVLHPNYYWYYRGESRF